MDTLKLLRLAEATMSLGLGSQRDTLAQLQAHLTKRGLPIATAIPVRFVDWLESKLGSRQWVVAARLTDRLRMRGYAVAISQKRYRDLEGEYLQELVSGTFDNR